MTYEQQLAAINATIAAKQKELGDIMTKSATEKRTLNDSEESLAKAAEDAIAKLEKNAERVQKLIEAQQKAKQTTTPVAGNTAEESQATAEGEKDPVKAAKQVTVTPNLDKGIGFAKAMRARVASQLENKKGNHVSALDIAKSRNEPEQVIQFLQKDAVIGRTTASEYEPLIQEEQLTNEFVELLRARTVFDKLTGFRNVPFNTRMVSQLTGSTAGWVGEGGVKPVTNPSYGTINISEHKLAAISVFTDEFLRNSKPKADRLFLEDLIIACAELIDSTFLSAQAGSTTTPAGILNGVTAITATGTEAEQYRADIQALAKQFLIANKSLSGAQLIMSEEKAFDMAGAIDAMGNTVFPGMDAQINSKAFKGINVIESESAGNRIIMIKPSEILLADDGRVDVSYSDQATIVNGAETLNLWQQNMSAVRVERFITWEKRRDTAVSVLEYA